MKRYAIIIAALALLLLCGCEAGVEASFRYCEDGATRKTVDLPHGYVLNDGHSYDITETESGYDITFHLRRADDATD